MLELLHMSWVVLPLLHFVCDRCRAFRLDCLFGDERIFLNDMSCSSKVFNSLAITKFISDCWPTFPRTLKSEVCAFTRNLHTFRFFECFHSDTHDIAMYDLAAYSSGTFQRSLVRCPRCSQFKFPYAGGIGAICSTATICLSTYTFRVGCELLLEIWWSTHEARYHDRFMRRW